MLSASLRRSGGSLILTVPQAWAEQNGLKSGAKLAVEIDGPELRLRPMRQRKTLAELLSATPEGLHRIEGWDEAPDVGAEA